MAKFIIEVSDEYIREMADGKKAVERMRESDDSALKALAEMMAFGNLRKELNEGATEFTVTPDDIDPDNEKEGKFFQSATLYFAMAYSAKTANEAKREKEAKEAKGE